MIDLLPVISIPVQAGDNHVVFPSARIEQRPDGRQNGSLGELFQPAPLGDADGSLRSRSPTFLSLLQTCLSIPWNSRWSDTSGMDLQWLHWWDLLNMA